MALKRPTQLVKSPLQLPAPDGPNVHLYVYARSIGVPRHRPLVPEVPLPHLAPPTLTAAEQKVILRATSADLRDPTIVSAALGTGRWKSFWR